MPETFEEVVKEAKETFGGTSPEAMTPEESAAFVESIREASGLSAAGFARAFGVAPETAESCLKGESIPQGAALATMRLAAIDPKFIAERVEANISAVLS